MNEFMKSLYVDLHNRLEKMISHLKTLSMESPVASEYKMTAVIALNKLKKKIAEVVNSGMLEEDLFARNLMIKFDSLHNEFIEIELFLYLPISKYDNKAEGYFEKVIQRIYTEIDSRQSVPFISTISNSDAYYWAYSKYTMIALPQGEEKYLLNLSDLYHEIGHLLFVQYEPFLVDDHLSAVKTHYNEKIRKADGRKKQTQFKKSLRDAIEYWDHSWSEELACDLIATYLVGPAYAWSHMKICALSGGVNEIYSRKNVFREHPPDEARMRAILLMLDLLGYTNESLAIKETWEQFLTKTRNSRSEYYDEIFTTEMLESITKNVYEGCKNITLQSYPDQRANNTRAVSLIINEAWAKMKEDPENFHLWESGQIQNLHSYTMF